MSLYVCALPPQELLTWLVVSVLVAATILSLLTPSIYTAEQGVVRGDMGEVLVEVRDEQGRLLGGKRAAIQFAHNLRVARAARAEVKAGAKSGAEETLEEVEVKTTKFEEAEEKAVKISKADDNFAEVLDLHAELEALNQALEYLTSLGEEGGRGGAEKGEEEITVKLGKIKVDKKTSRNHKNPLFKSVKKPKMSAVKKESFKLADKEMPEGSRTGGRLTERGGGGRRKVGRR